VVLGPVCPCVARVVAIATRLILISTATTLATRGKWVWVDVDTKILFGLGWWNNRSILSLVVHQWWLGYSVVGWVCD
jgi:hypothetical protein